MKRKFKTANHKRTWRTTQGKDPYHPLPATKPPVGARDRVGKLGIHTSTIDTPQVSVTIRSQQSRPSKRKPSMPKMPWD